MKVLHGYFEHIASRLNIEDMEVLGILFDNEATSSFKAMKNQRVFELSKFSEAKYRRTIGRLAALSLIESDTTTKSHSLIITNYGIAAIQKTVLESRW